MPRIYIDIKNWSNHDNQWFSSDIKDSCKVSDLKKAIADGWNPDTENKHGLTLLEYVFQKDYKMKVTTQKVMKLLMDNGASVRGEKLFSDWVDPDRFSIFLDYDLDANTFGERKNYFFQRMMKVLDWKHELSEKITDKLLEANFDINGVDTFYGEGNTLLHILADDYFGRQSKKMIYLLDKGANPFLLDNQGRTPYELWLKKCDSSWRSDDLKDKFEEAMKNWKGKKPVNLNWDWSEEFWLGLTKEIFNQKIEEGYSLKAENQHKLGILWHINQYCNDKGVFEKAAELGLFDDDKYKDLPLYTVAVHNKEKELLEFWLQQRPDLATTPDYFTAFVQSEDSLDLEIGDIYLKYGADLDELCFTFHEHCLSYSPLMTHLIFGDDPAPIEYLLDKGADPLRFDGMFASPIDYAHKFKNKWTDNGIIALLEEKADPKNPLWIIKYGDVKAVKKLYDKRADEVEEISEMFSSYYTNPFFLACAFNPNIEVIQYFIDKGEALYIHDEEPNTYDERGGVVGSYHLALAWAVKFSSNLEIIDLLYEKTPTNVWQLTFIPHFGIQVPLLFASAAYNTNEEVSKYLIDKGVEMNPTINWNGYHSPLSMAAKLNPNPEVIKVLLQNGAKPTIKKTQYEGVSAIHSFSKNIHLYEKENDVLKWLKNPNLVKN